MQVKNRQRRKMGMERLENRSLMAGNISVQLTGNTLSLQGDGGDNTVAITRGRYGDSNLLFVDGKGTSLNGVSNARLSFSVDSVQNIKASLGDGIDDLDLYGDLNLASVDVIMGKGVQDFVHIAAPSRIDSISVLARDTNYARVSIEGNVGNLNVETGARRDEVFLKGSINNATVKTGAGNDDLNLKDAQITSLRAEMGRGRDTVTFVNSSVDTGLINGGPGSDKTVKGLRRVSRNFEMFS